MKEEIYFPSPIQLDFHKYIKIGWWEHRHGKMYEVWNCWAWLDPSNKMKWRSLIQ